MHQVKFPSYITNTFRIIICVTLLWEIGYLSDPETFPFDKVFNIVLKIAVCFTAIISYINDKEKMAVISKKGFLIEKMELDENTLHEKFSFVYILIIIAYNPILPIFYDSFYWIMAHIFTILFLGYKIWYFKKYASPKNTE